MKSGLCFLLYNEHLLLKKQLLSEVLGATVLIHAKASAVLLTTEFATLVANSMKY